MLKKVCSITALVALPLTALGLLWYSLESYKPHTDGGLFVQIYVSVIFVICLFIWIKRRKDGRVYNALAIYSVIILAISFYVAGKIPFCPMCDGLTSEDLGFLTHWIPLAH